MPHSLSTDISTLSDADLIALHRVGDQYAYAQLWERHYNAGVRAARAITGSHDPDDLVQESFTRILSTLGNGNGPTENFRAYLYATIRSVSIAWSGKLEPTIDISTQESALVSETDFVALTEDKRLTVRAFKDLPEDWRTVLWYSEIEGMTPAEIAPLMGLSARSVSALSFRAREGLRESWLQAHLPERSTAASNDCQWAEKHLGSYSRGSLTPKRTTRLEDHLRDCTQCSLLLAELNLVGQNLRAALLPLFLGLTPAAIDAVFPIVIAGASSTAATSLTTGPFSSLKQWATNNPGAAIGSAAGVAVAAVIATGLALASGTPDTQASPIQSPSQDTALNSEPQSPAVAPQPSQRPVEPPTVVPTQATATRESYRTAIEPRPAASDTLASEVTSEPSQPSTEDEQPSVTPVPSSPAVVPPSATPQPEPTDSSTRSETPSEPAEPTEMTEPSEPAEPEPTVLPLAVLTVSDPAQIQLMPRFSGTAQVGTEVQLFDLAHPDVAVSERIEITADAKSQGRSESQTISALTDSTLGTLFGSDAPANDGSDAEDDASATDEPQTGQWALHVSSTAPVGSNLRYVVKNFADGEVISTTEIPGTFHVEQTDASRFTMLEFMEHSGPGHAIEDYGTLLTDTSLDQLTVRFRIESKYKGAFQFYLNDIQRVTNYDVDLSWRWQPSENNVAFRTENNTIGIRLVENDGEYERYGPYTRLFTFNIASDSDTSGDPDSSADTSD